jgi:hypothetical protein
MGPIVVSHMRLLLALVVEDLAASGIKLMPLRHPFQTSHPDLVETTTATTTIVHLVSSLRRVNVEMVPTASFLTIVAAAEVLVDLAIKIQHLAQEALDQLLPQVPSDRLLFLLLVHSVAVDLAIKIQHLAQEDLHRHLPQVPSDQLLFLLQVPSDQLLFLLQVHSEEVEHHLEEEGRQHLDLGVVLLPLLDLLCRIVILHSADLDDNDKKLTFYRRSSCRPPHMANLRTDCNTMSSGEETCRLKSLSKVDFSILVSV